MIAAREWANATLDAARMRKRGFHGWTLRLSLFSLACGFEVGGDFPRSGVELVDLLSKQAGVAEDELKTMIDFEAVEEEVKDGNREDEAPKHVRIELSSSEVAFTWRADAGALGGARLGKRGSSMSANKADILAVLDCGSLVGCACLPTAK